MLRKRISTISIRIKASLRIIFCSFTYIRCRGLTILTYEIILIQISFQISWFWQRTLINHFIVVVYDFVNVLIIIFVFVEYLILPSWPRIALIDQILFIHIHLFFVYSAVFWVPIPSSVCHIKNNGTCDNDQIGKPEIGERIGIIKGIIYIRSCKNVACKGMVRNVK